MEKRAVPGARFEKGVQCVERFFDLGRCPRHHGGGSATAARSGARMLLLLLLLLLNTVTLLLRKHVRGDTLLAVRQR